MNQVTTIPGEIVGVRLRRSSPSTVGVATFSRSLVTVTDPFGEQAEAIRALRTYVMARHFDEGRRALAICAASRNVGCHFIAANLAVALSQIGVNTVLINGNMRRPGLDMMTRPPRAPGGLQQWLVSPDASFRDVIEPNMLPNLSVINSGGAASNPQELLAGDRFKALMDFCLRDFDATIVDTPPANSCSDARRIAAVVGYCLVVTRRHASFINDVKMLISQLQGDHARVVGTVLNDW